MAEKIVKNTGDVLNNLNPSKTIQAVRSMNIPPLICLACLNSNDRGQCKKPRINLEKVAQRWNSQIIIDPDSFQESINPDTPLAYICNKFNPEL